MSATTDNPRRLMIKKYSNRRFYDATRSQHLTLTQMYDLICEGYDLTVTDADTKEDITNVVLTQILLERDPMKLVIFPANVLHQIIRTQQQLLGGVVEQFFKQALETHKASQDRWASFLQNTLGGAPGLPANPLDWSRTFFDAFNPATRPASPEVPPPAPPPAPGAPTRAAASQSGADERAEIDELRRQIAELTRKVEAKRSRGRRK